MRLDADRVGNHKVGDNNMIRLATLTSLAKLDLNIVPLREYSQKPSMAWADIYDNDALSIREITQNVEDFQNLATCFGFTFFDNYKPYYSHCLDINSESVLKILTISVSLLCSKETAEVNAVMNYALADTAERITMSLEILKESGYVVESLNSSSATPQVSSVWRMQSSTGPKDCFSVLLLAVPMTLSE